MPWNVLIYMSGDNDLADEMVWGLQDIRDITNQYPNAKANVVVQFDPLGGYPRMYEFKEKSPLASLDTYVQDKLEPDELRTRHVETFAREVLLDLKSSPSLSTHEPSNVRALGQHDNNNKVDQAIEIFEELTETPKPSSIDHAAETLSVPTGQLSEIPNTSLDQGVRSWIKQHTDLILDDISVRAQLQSFVIEQIGQLPRYEGQKYAIVLAGHGTGVAGDFLEAQDPRSSLSIEGIDIFLRLTRVALNYTEKARTSPRRDWWKAVEWSAEPAAQDKKIDVLGLDTCLVSMAEICYQVRHHASYLVGTESFVSDNGWSYKKLLAPVLADRSLDEVVKDFVRGYVEFYRDYEEAGSSTDMVAVQLDGMDEVTKQVRYLSNKITPILRRLNAFDEIDELDLFANGSPVSEKQGENLRKAIVDAAEGPVKLEEARRLRNALILAHWYAQSYLAENYTDLWDFCGQLRRFCPGDEFIMIREHCHEVQKAVKLAANIMNTVGPASQHSHGLSVYFPWDAAGYSNDYRNLQFAKDAEWDEFLREYLRVTRRVRRDQEKNLDIGSLKPTKPIRHGLDTDPLGFELRDSSNEDSEALKGLLEKLESRHYPRHGTRAYPQHGTRAYPQYGTRAYPQYGTRAYPQYGTRSEKFGGTAAKNPPDGFYRRS